MSESASEAIVRAAGVVIDSVREQTGPMLADDLSDLWDGEGCKWSVRYESGDGPWVVRLDWWTDYATLHDATFAKFTWDFYGDTLDEALTGAVDFCWSLHWLERCGECDGQGSWNGAA